MTLIFLREGPFKQGLVWDHMSPPIGPAFSMEFAATPADYLSNVHQNLVLPFLPRYFQIEMKYARRPAAYCTSMLCIAQIYLYDL